MRSAIIAIPIVAIWATWLTCQEEHKVEDYSMPVVQIDTVKRDTSHWTIPPRPNLGQDVYF